MSASENRNREAIGLLGDTGELVRISAVAEIHQSSRDSAQWIVWAVDTDGAMQETVFSGPSSEQRAIEYARAKYAGLRQRVRRPPQYP